MDLKAGTIKYEGETDKFGRRHGRGKMTYQDGSWYDGDWDCGLRHGVGEMHSKQNDKTTIYRGQWYNDLKHGIGEEEYPEKLFNKFYNVRGIWFHN